MPNTDYTGESAGVENTPEFRNPTVVTVLTSAPDLQELVSRYGQWNLIPPEAWEDWDRAMAAWVAALRIRHLNGPAIAPGAPRRGR